MTHPGSNPYIGLRTYEEADAAIFRGRRAATAELYHMIAANDVVVLHAESGEGKSSLLNAGLFPLLREERYFPIKVNFTEEDFALALPNFDLIVYRRIVDALEHAAEGPAGAPLKLEPLTDDRFDPARFPALRCNVWWLLRNYALTVFGAQLTPILVFDQFEEVFTRPGHIAWTEAFFAWLATTLSDNIPAHVATVVRNAIGPEAEFPRIHTRKRFKALLSQRTEFMGELDYWGIQRHGVAVLKNSRYCLKPLTEAEADEVLTLQPAFTPELRERLKLAICSALRVGISTEGLPLIPAMLLSVVSTTASESLGNAGSPLAGLDEAADTGDGRNDVFLNIISQFYDKEVADTRLPKKDIAVIEDVLVDDKGKRVRIKADAMQLRAIDFEQRYKGVLEQKRLLKSSRINGDEYVELTHDALARVVMRRRRQRESVKNSFVGLGMLFLLGALAFLCLWLCLTATCGVALWHSLKPADIQAPGIAMRPVALALNFGYALLLAGAGCAAWKLSAGRRPLVAVLVQTLCFGLALIAVAAIKARFSRGVPNDLYFWSVAVLAPAEFAAGNALCRCRSWLLKVPGICLLAAAFMVVAGVVPAVALTALLIVAVFGLAAYSFTRERNAMWLSLMAAAAVYFTAEVVPQAYSIYGFGLVNMPVKVMMVILLGLAVYSARLPRRRSLEEALRMVFAGEVYRKYKVLRYLFGGFLLLWLLNVAAAVGVYADLGMSLVAAPLLALALYVVYYRVLTRRRPLGDAYVVLLATIYLSVLAIGLSYLSTWQLWLIVGLVMLSLYVIHRWAIRRTGSALTVWLLCVVLPAAYGYGITPSRNGTYVASLRSVEDASGVRLLRVKDKAGRHGLQDKAGCVVIACDYDSVIPYRQGGRAVCYVLLKDGHYTRWRTSNHLLERNALTDDYVARFIRNERERSIYSTPDEYQNALPASDRIMLAALKERKPETLDYEEYAEGLITNRILQRINGRYDTDYRRLDAGDSTLMHRLGLVPYDKAGLGLLPYASKAFRDEFMSGFFPKLQFRDGKKVEDALGAGLDSLKLAEPDVYGRYCLGELLTRLASYYLETADYDRALRCSELALRHGAFAEPALVDHIVAGMLKGDPQAQAPLKADPLQLVRINAGLSYPDPGLEDAWVFLRYRPLYDLVADRLEQLRLPQSIPAAELARAGETLGQIPRGEAFDHPMELPYTAVQLLPDSLGGGRRYFGPFMADRSYGTVRNAVREYSFFTKGAEVVAGPMMCYSYPNSEAFEDLEDPIVLVVDWTTGKRRYIKGGYDLMMARSGAPEYLPGEYTHAWPFSEGLAAVEVDGRIGFIDRSGAMAIEPRFSPNYRVGTGLAQKFLDLYTTFRVDRRRLKAYSLMPYFGSDSACPVYDGTELMYIDRYGEPMEPYTNP